MPPDPPQRERLAPALASKQMPCESHGGSPFERAPGALPWIARMRGTCERFAERFRTPIARGRRLLAGLCINRMLQGCLILVACLAMFLFVVLPLLQLLSKSLADRSGHFVGMDNFIRYFHTPALSRSLYNTFFVSAFTTVVAVSLGFAYAYALTRTDMRWKNLFRSVAMIPLFAPTLLHGITLVYLFGKKGIVTTGFFGALQELTGLSLGFDIGLYGAPGIIISEVIYAFPQATILLSVALSMTDARLYEASEALGASKARTFFTVTLPGVKYGLISAFFVCFILAFTDFGAPKVVGGNFNVLATDIYKQVIGQQNFEMGATVSVILLLPAVIAFAVDLICRRRQVAMVASKAVPYRPKKHPLRDGAYFSYCLLVSLALAIFLGTAAVASLVKVWPYDFSLSLENYRFTQMGGGGYSAFFNSVRMSLYSALFGALVTFCAAYLLEKSTGMQTARKVAYLLSILPLALPGLVIGLSYIFFFNSPRWSVFPLGLEIVNPFHFLYGTMGVLVISNIVHFYTVSFLTATTALRQLDKEFEAVSESLGVPFYKTFARVTVPVCLPAIVEIATYYFVNSMATVSAVIFLYSADIPLASVAVANMDDAGDTAPAAAMCILIVVTSALFRWIFRGISGRLSGKTQLWTVR